MTNSNTPTGGDQLTEVKALLSALVMLQLELREQRLAQSPNASKAEIVLADAGVELPLICRLLGKNPEAVRKTIQRSRIGTQRRRPQSDG
ncbi:MAG: hypothetical protein WD598_15175 [Acidimicrobiia bacterium]